MSFNFTDRAAMLPTMMLARQRQRARLSLAASYINADANPVGGCSGHGGVLREEVV